MPEQFGEREPDILNVWVASHGVPLGHHAINDCGCAVAISSYLVPTRIGRADSDNRARPTGHEFRQNLSRDTLYLGVIKPESHP